MKQKSRPGKVPAELALKDIRQCQNIVVSESRGGDKHNLRTRIAVATSTVATHCHLQIRGLKTLKADG